MLFDVSFIAQIYICLNKFACITFCSSVTDVGGIIGSAGFRLLENMKAATMAVSGTRKVACVVSADVRIVLILPHLKIRF